MSDGQTAMSEWTLVITILGAAVGRQQEFERKGPPEDFDCHLYIVSSRPRMSVDPGSVTISDAEVKFILRLQQAGSFDEYPLEGRHSFGPGPWNWLSEWPFEEFRISHAHSGEVAMSGVVAMLQKQSGEQWPPSARKHHVLYIGQAFGRDGDRTAWDRLKSHSTLQRILAETRLDQQVWLTLAAVTDLSAFCHIVGIADSLNPDSDKERDEKILHAVYKDASFRERDSVALAEAGLIRHFQPKYNERLKNRFPNVGSVPLKSIRDLDFFGLIVELQGQEVNAEYGTDTVDYDSLHVGRFIIHNDANRADPFEYLTPAPGFQS